MADSDEYDALYERASEAIEALIEGLDPGAFVTGFLLVAEILDAENERSLWAFTPPTQKAWQTLGYAQFASQEEQSLSLARRLRDG